MLSKNRFLDELRYWKLRYQTINPIIELTILCTCMFKVKKYEKQINNPIGETIVEKISDKDVTITIESQDAKIQGILVWSLTLQQEIGLSTIESEYIPSSSVTREILVPQRELQNNIGVKMKYKPAIVHSTEFDDNYLVWKKHIAVKYHLSKSKIGKEKGIILQKINAKDLDTPTFNEDMSGPHREQFIKAMYKEIKTLESLKTWNVIQKSDVPTD